MRSAMREKKSRYVLINNDNLKRFNVFISIIDMVYIFWGKNKSMMTFEITFEKTNSYMYIYAVDITHNII